MNRTKERDALLRRAAEWRLADLRQATTENEAHLFADAAQTRHEEMVEALDAWLATFPESLLREIEAGAYRAIEKVTEKRQR